MTPVHGGGEDSEDGDPPPSTSFTPMVFDESMNWSTESVQIETIQDISGSDSKAVRDCTPPHSFCDDHLVSGASRVRRNCGVCFTGPLNV